MTNNEHDVVIIGGGQNGLICSAYLARTGLDVLLLEARHETGGGLDTLEFCGHKYNLHAVYHMMAEIMPVYHDFNLKDKGVRYIYPEVQAAFLNKDQKPLVFYHDPSRTADYLSSAFSKKDGESFTRMYQDFKEFSEKIVMPMTYVPAMPSIDVVMAFDMSSDDVGKRYNEMSELTPVEIIEQYGFSDVVRAGLYNLFSMWGLSDYDGVGFLFPLYVYRMLNAALCVGGSHRLSSSLHRIAAGAGVKILDKAEVVKVIMNNSRAGGVLLEDGTEFRAKAVVSTVDPKQNFLSFFDEDQIPDDLVESAKNWEWEKSTFFGTHVALKEAPDYTGAEDNKDVNRAMIVFNGIDDIEKILDHLEEVESGKLPEIPLGHATCTTLFDPLQAPRGYHTCRFETLVPFDCDWDNIKDDYGRKCIETWKEYAPNIEPLNTLFYPPTYIEKKIKSMVRGSFKHGSYKTFQIGYNRPNSDCSQIVTPIEGFYVCGASVNPGGMIIGGGGYIAANIIADDFGVKKDWDEIESVKRARKLGFIPE